MSPDKGKEKVVVPPDTDVLTLHPIDQEEVAKNIGFDWIGRLKLSQDHIDLDFPPGLETLGRAHEIAGERFVPDFSEAAREALAKMLGEIDQAAALNLYTGGMSGDAYLLPKARGVSELFRENLKDPLARRLALRVRALQRAQILSMSPATTAISGLLLARWEAFRTMGLSHVMALPQSVIQAAHGFMDKRQLLGGDVVDFFNASVSDPAAHREIARQRNAFMRERLITLFDDVPTDDIVEFHEESATAARNLKAKNGEMGTFNALRQIREALNSALRTYAQLKTGKDQSHFGSILRTTDGALQILGAGSIVQMLEGAGEFGSDRTHLIFPRIDDRRLPPFVTSEGGSRLDSHDSTVQGRIDRGEAQAQFLRYMTRELFDMMKAIDARHKVTATGDGLSDMKRSLRYGVVTTLLTVNLSIMTALFGYNSLVKKSWEELLKDPYAFIGDSEKVSDFAWASHFDLTMASRLAPAFEDTLAAVSAVLEGGL